MNSRRRKRELVNAGKSGLITLITLALLFIFLSPFLFMIFTSLKTQSQITSVGSPIWPAEAATYEYNGKELEQYTVPMGTCVGSEDDTSNRDLAIVTKGLKESVFIDPDNLDRGEFSCSVAWRALSRPWQWAPAWSNYAEVWETIRFPRVMWNTFFYAMTTLVGTLICPHLHHLFARLCDGDSNVHLLPKDWLGGYLAAFDCAALFCQRVQRLPAAAVFHDDAACPG